MEVGGPPFLPEDTCPLAVTVFPGLLCTGLTPGPTTGELEPTGGGGFQSGGGEEVVGVPRCDFLPMDVNAGTGGGGEMGAPGEE